MVIVLLISSRMCFLACYSEVDYFEGYLKDTSVYVGMKSYFLNCGKTQKKEYMVKGLSGSAVNFYQEVVRVLLCSIYSRSSSPIVIITII